jgi:hypothetical protein
MMHIAQDLLLEELLELTEASIIATKEFQSLSLSQLNAKRNAAEWSILECIEHLNLYGDFYLPEIEKQMLASQNISYAPVFKSGVLGNYFAHLMKTKESKMKKMKSPKDKKPANSILSITTLDRFVKQQERLKKLLHQAQRINLTKTKTAISISPIIKLRMGDTFRFFVYHIERHIQQAKRVIS